MLLTETDRKGRQEGTEKWTKDFPYSEHKCKADQAATENIPRGMVKYQVRDFLEAYK